MFCVHVSLNSWLFFILQDFGGSAKVAKELYNMLQPKNADFVSEEELKERLDHALKLYLKKKDDDKSGLKSTQNFRVTFFWVSKVTRDGISFASLCTMIGPEKLLNLLNLLDAKLKSMTTWPIFPCFIQL